MANLRLIELIAVDSTHLQAKFTDSLDPLLNTGNVSIASNIAAIPSPRVLDVDVLQDLLVITTHPLTPLATYFVTFQSGLVRFTSNGGNFLVEDGRTNVSMVLGAEDPANPIRDFLTGYLKDNIYDLGNGTVVRDIINSQANDIARALYDVGQTKNDNYLSFTVLDEIKTRGGGPYDRLNEEGAYEILRVGKNRLGNFTSTSMSFDEFPTGPITLQAQMAVETLIAGTAPGTFNGLTLNLSNRPVTKLTRLTIKYKVGGSFVYTIGTFGYQLNDPRYDQDFASAFVMEDDQIKLSAQLLSLSGFILPGVLDKIVVTYEYKNLGRYVDDGSVGVAQVLTSTREVAPPIVTVFNLLHAPIVTPNDILATSSGVVWLDPNGAPPFASLHPAFLKELTFHPESLPSQPGEYAIDYPNGAVYVWGASSNDGTGDFPPTATYCYRQSFSSRLDFTYDPDALELVASPLRELGGQTAKISFAYDDNLVAGIDYNPQIHQEALDERVENRINSSISVSPKFTPITNVFRIFNETSGEIYKVTRFSDNAIYFNGLNSPRILSSTERVSFANVTNELMMAAELNSAVRVFKIPLSNNRIMSATEDLIGSSFNSSVTFSRTDIFQNEIYFDGQTSSLSDNLVRLTIGLYTIDYQNGVVYVGVAADQSYDIGTINYKRSVIVPAFPHLTGVSELYYSIDNIIQKRIPYVGFADNSISPEIFDISDERFFGGDSTMPYLVEGNQITVTENINELRGIFDHYDLMNNFGTNLAPAATFAGNVITLGALPKTETLIIQSGLILNLSFISNGVDVSNLTITRISDNVSLNGTLSGYTVTLNGTGSPLVGDKVLVSYQLTMNGGATPIVDYDRGGYFADYNYLADEILISYEYGDNCLDYRQSHALDEGTTYYASYKVGARRDTLLKNFGSLVDLPILNTFDTSLPRERYRDALMAALQSFTKGPTIPAMSLLVSKITHIDPQIIESIFEYWSLGMSHLYPQPIDWTGNIQLMAGRFDNGVLLDQPDQTITFPVSSNLRLEEGSMEMWVLPEWNGLDNDAILTFSSLKVNGTALDPSKIWISSTSFHPTSVPFALNKSESEGLPSAVFTQTGLFIYYDTVAKRWKTLAKDSVASSKKYTGLITSSGEVYDVKFIPGLGEINDVLRSSGERIEFEFNIDAIDGYSPDGYADGYDGYIDGYADGYDDGYEPIDGYVGYSFDGIDFMADDLHYLFDFGSTPTTNRFSLFKDGRGYLNFEVWDRGNRKRKNNYKISADISNWNAGEKHHLGLSWRLSSSDRRDEMHLFIDGFEIPNIIKYGGRPIASSTDRFRTIKPEILVGVVPLTTVGSNDLQTMFGSTVVTSGINFSAAGIVGGTITIREIGFATYNILSVNGNSLILDTPMPATLINARFSVNEYSTVVASEVDLYNNIAVSIIHNGVETEIAGLRANDPQYSVSKNLLNQNILTLFGSAKAGDSIAIRTFGINHRRCRERQYIWGNTSNILKSQLPPPINLDGVSIVAVLLPFYTVAPSNSTLSGGLFTSTVTTSQPSNSTEGRTLAVRLNGNNVNFATPVTVTIVGDITQTLSFTSAGIQNTNKFKTINHVTVVAKPLVATKPSVGVEIKEAFSLTYSEGNSIYPIVRFSYKTQTGTHLAGAGLDATLTDSAGYFPISSIGQKLTIYFPPTVAGTYNIIGRTDNNTITIDANLAEFSDGVYDIFNTAISRSGFENGFFTLEQAGEVNVPFPLNQGYFEFDYQVNLEIPFDPLTNQRAFLGSDLNGSHQAKAILDEFVITSNKLTDVRIGETISAAKESITTDFTRFRPLKPTSNTLMLLHLDSFPLVNSADFWVIANRDFIQSDASVNDNFNKSLVITSNPFKVDNNGYLSTTSEGTIEFWVSPRFDTYNDPNFRFYFDASGSIIEDVTSITNGTVKVSNRIGQVLSVRLATDVENLGTDFFQGGKILNDFQTLQLSTALPFQQTPLRVNYIPAGLDGNRISIYKDQEGFLTFNVRSGGEDFQVRQPIFWDRDSWHKVRCTFKLNRADHLDEIRMWADSEERGMIKFGQGLLFGSGIVFGQGFAGVDNSILVADINFTDPVNEFFIGSDYFGVHSGEARFDNFKISNIARQPFTSLGQPLDLSYASNLSTVFPAVTDAFTTYLLDFDSIAIKNENFALLRDEKFGIFNFTLNIIDTFDIVKSSAKVKQILETLINVLKPAQSKTTINYV